MRRIATNLLCGPLLLVHLLGPTPVGAALIINEIMYDPIQVSDTDGEWFEIYNSGASLDLQGYSISDSSTSVSISSPLIIPASGYLVFGRNSDPSRNGGLAVDYLFSFSLNNTSTETLSLTDPGSLLVDSITYGPGTSFPSASGASICFSGIGSHTDGSNWMDATLLGRTYGAGDYGTPGGPNVSAVPEPASLMLLGSGMVGLRLLRRRR